VTVRAIRAFTLLLTLSALSIAALAQPRLGPPVFRVIVHPSNPVTSVDRKFLADAFLKKTTRWSHEQAIRPVDQRSDSAARNKFSEEVLRQPVDAVKNYWQQVIFTGRDVPPPELDSDEDVVKYVLKYPGGLGYVSGSANLNGAKVVTLQ
jgi:ABC-type phosphate transport system substrate-binding protein